jgi:predicted nucleotidyltransferase
VARAFLFGSATNEKFSDKSDVDFIVELNDGVNPVDAGGHLWSLIFELEDLLQRPVDLITEKSIRNPVFKQEVQRSKVPVYGS